MEIMRRLYSEEEGQGLVEYVIDYCFDFSRGNCSNESCRC